jgi:hypothetical protein
MRPEAEKAETEERTVRKKFRFQLLLLAAAFLVMPFVMGYKEGRLPFSELEVLKFRKVPCEIISATVVRTGRNTWKPYEPKIKYRFILAGETHESDSAGDVASGSFREASELAERFRIAKANFCYVDTQSLKSVLIRFSRDQQFDLLFPVLLVTYAVLLFVGVAIARSVDQLQLLRKIALMCVCALAIGVGLWGFELAAKGTWKTIRAAKWPEVRCEILLNDLQVDRDNKGKLIYRPDVLYRYEKDGEVFTSNQLDFFEESSGKIQEDLYQKFPVGTRTVCRVNPRTKGDSVLWPRWSVMALVAGAAGLLPSTIGGVFLWFMLANPGKLPAFERKEEETVLEAAGIRFQFWLWLFFIIIVNFALFVSLSEKGNGTVKLNVTQWMILIGVELFCFKMGWPKLKPMILAKPKLRLPRNYLSPGESRSIKWDLPKSSKLDLELVCLEWKSNAETFKEIHRQMLFRSAGDAQINEATILLPESATRSVIEKGRVVNWEFRARVDTGTWRQRELSYSIKVCDSKPNA